MGRDRSDIASVLVIEGRHGVGLCVELLRLWCLRKMRKAALGLISDVHVFWVRAILIVRLLNVGRYLVERVIALHFEDAVERGQPYELLLGGSDKKPDRFVLVRLQAKGELPLALGLQATLRVIDDLVDLPHIVLLVNFASCFGHFRLMNRKSLKLGRGLKVKESFAETAGILFIAIANNLDIGGVHRLGLVENYIVLDLPTWLGLTLTLR